MAELDAHAARAATKLQQLLPARLRARLKTISTAAEAVPHAREEPPPRKSVPPRPRPRPSCDHHPVLDIGYSLSPRFPDPPQTDYATADSRALRHDLFCGDVYLADTEADEELSTAWGWVPVLDFAWALCDLTEELDRDPLGGRAPGPYRAEFDFTESADRLRFERRFGTVEITADWTRAEAPVLAFPHVELRRETRDFLHDVVADLTDMHEGLAYNPVVLGLLARLPRV